MNACQNLEQKKRGGRFTRRWVTLSFSKILNVPTKSPQNVGKSRRNSKKAKSSKTCDGVRAPLPRSSSERFWKCGRCPVDVWNENMHGCSNSVYGGSFLLQRTVFMSAIRRKLRILNQIIWTFSTHTHGPIKKFSIFYSTTHIFKCEPHFCTPFCHNVRIYIQHHIIKKSWFLSELFNFGNTEFLFLAVMERKQRNI